MPNDNDTSRKGVVYSRIHRAGFFRRLIATTIDIFVLLLIGFILANLWIIINLLEPKPLPPAFFVTWLVFAYLYLALLKPTKIRTLGFMVAGLKIVDLKGTPPSFWTMSLRFVLLGFVLLGPIYILFDLLWLLNDPNGQTFLDKAAGTYVVKKEASPMANGVQTTIVYHFLGLTFVLREVKLERQRKVDLEQSENDPSEDTQQMAGIEGIVGQA